MTKLPSFQFYPGDWRKDPELARCSKAAKGLWIDMICLSFECEDRGMFSTGDVPWTDTEIAGAVGGDIPANLVLLAELLGKGVCSRNQSGALFCRRVVRDENKRKTNSDRQRRFRNSVNNETVTPLSEDEGEDEKKRGKGRAETMGEVIAFCREIGLPRSDAEWFWNKCEENGWTKGNPPIRIRDWRLTLRSWQSGGFVPSIKNPRKGVTPPAQPKLRPTEPPPTDLTPEQIAKNKAVIGPLMADLTAKLTGQVGNPS